jgi:pimeloyl-ACP methyl ester carboxylesterase
MARRFRDDSEPSMQGEPQQHHFDAPEVRLEYFTWGPADGVPVLMVHATGFHARCWDRTIAALPDRYRVIAVDMRGHGRSGKRGPYRWESFGRDLEAFAQGLGIAAAIGVGHSMGGHCVAQVAAWRPEVFRRLLLVDPVILDPASLASNRDRAFAAVEDHPVARRRNRWASWQEMFERFRDRHPFSLWRLEVLEDYCRYGLLPAADGDGFELACPPVVEASTYMGNSQSDIHGLLPQIRIPVVVLRARTRRPEDAEVMDFSKSPTWPGLAASLPDGRDVHLPHLSHFIPMEDPELVARFIDDPDAAFAEFVTP